MSPVMEQGRMVGLLLSRLMVGSPLWKAGLRDNDVITKVNGIDLTHGGDTAKAVRAFETTPSKSCNIVYRRGVPPNAAEHSIDIKAP
jgi:type II secretory pathway component PulC